MMGKDDKVSFSVCDDATWVHDRISQPDVIEVSFPDGVECPSCEQIKQCMDRDDLEFINIFYEDDRLGFFLLELKFPIIEVHTVISKDKRGISAFRAAAEFPEWVFDSHPGCEVLLTQVPKYNRPAGLFAARSGLRKKDSQGSIFCKNGKAEEMDIYAIERIDICQ